MELPRLFGLRLWWAEVSGDERRAASLRWTRINAMRPRGCQCGAPGTVRVLSPFPVIGTVLPEFWRCEDHRSVPLTTGWINGKPVD